MKFPHVYQLVVVRWLMMLLLTISINVFACDSADNEKCILFIGNSITLHGSAPELGWYGSWGMAASSQDKDYVAQLVNLLTKESSPIVWHPYTRNLSTIEKNPAAFEVDTLINKYSLDIAKNADVVVVELGDNFNSSSSSKTKDFAAAYLRLLKALHTNKGVLVCVSTWWSAPDKDKVIQENCKIAGGSFVDISDLSKKEENVARNERNIANKGVGAHPSDKGMRAIAEKIFNTINIINN